MKKPYILLIAAPLFAFSSFAQASDWGCECLLCLSDPRGPTTENECVPPITRLWKHLAKGGSMPKCEMAGGSWAQKAKSPYELCPDGSETVANGVAAITAESDSISIGIGDGGEYVAPDRYRYPKRINEGMKICGHDFLATETITEPVIHPGDLRDRITHKDARIYKNITALPRRGGQAIDVYVNDKLFKRVFQR